MVSPAVALLGSPGLEYTIILLSYFELVLVIMTGSWPEQLQVESLRTQARKYQKSRLRSHHDLVEQWFAEFVLVTELVMGQMADFVGESWSEIMR